MAGTALARAGRAGAGEAAARAAGGGRARRRARRAPHRLTAYAHELASDFHAFYRDCRVVGAEPRELEDFRLCLAASTKAVIARVLDLLGVEAPEQM